MSKVYNIAFRMGVLFNILLWTILNVLSLTVMKKRAEEITFGVEGSNWGFPFEWGKRFWILTDGYSILNIIVMVFGCLVFGFLFKFVWSKISRRSAELK